MQVNGVLALKIPHTGKTTVVNSGRVSNSLTALHEEGGPSKYHSYLSKKQCIKSQRTTNKSYTSFSSHSDSGAENTTISEHAYVRDSIESQTSSKRQVHVPSKCRDYLLFWAHLM